MREKIAFYRRILLICFIVLITLTLRAADQATSTTLGKQYAFLRSQYHYFHSLSEERQKQIRALDETLASWKDPNREEAILRVMQRYAIWLDHLSEKDRQSILDKPTLPGKLLVIHEVRDRLWLQSLPKAYRDRYYSISDPVEKANLMVHWKEQEQIRHTELRWYSSNPRKAGVYIRAKSIFDNPENKKQFQQYINHLEKVITTKQDTKDLKLIRRDLDQGQWVVLINRAWLFARKHPLIPDQISGPARFVDLPPNVKNSINELQKKHPNDQALKDLNKTNHTWPTYAIHVNTVLRKYKVHLDHSFGPTKPAEFSKDVRDFITQILVPKLNASPEGKKDLQSLRAVEGEWPEYPQKIMELARKYKLSVAGGWSLPAIEDWEQIYNQFPKWTPKRNRMSMPPMPKISKSP